jgi:hypothetical protein
MHLATKPWSKIAAAFLSPSSPSSPVGSTHSSLSDRERRFDIRDAQRLCFESEVESERGKHARVASKEEIRQMYLNQRPPPIKAPEAWELTEKKRGVEVRDVVLADESPSFDVVIVGEVKTIEYAPLLPLLEINIVNQTKGEKGGNPFSLGHGIDTILATINQQFALSTIEEDSTAQQITSAQDEDDDIMITYEDSLLSLYSLNRTSSSITDHHREEADEDSYSAYSSDCDSSADEDIKSMLLGYDG